MQITSYKLAFAVLLLLTGTAVGADPAEAAKRQASQELRKQVMNQPVGRQLTVGKLTDDLNAQRELDEVLAQAHQVGGVRWVDNGTCQVRVELEAARVRNRLLDIASRDEAKPPISPERLRKLLDGWRIDRFVATGTGGAITEVQQDSVQQSSFVAQWSDEMIDATASARPSRSRLHTARAAEHSAREELRKKVQSLPLQEGKTVGEATADDAKLARALDRTVTRARVTKVDYAAEGGVSVRVSLDLQDLWRAMSQRH